jgi:hypothetical protein
LILGLDYDAFKQLLQIGNSLHDGQEAKVTTMLIIADGRRDGRVAEGDGLLNRYTVKSRIGGSNPPLSASFHKKAFFLKARQKFPSHQAYGG